MIVYQVEMHYGVFQGKQIGNLNVTAVNNMFKITIIAMRKNVKNEPFYYRETPVLDGMPP
jgi:hypothetical protein